MNNFLTPDILGLRVPIPFPLRDVNMYILRGKHGWTLVDTGMGTSEAREAFAQGLTEAGLHIENLEAIVLTHHHPDHVGLSGELYEQSNVPVYMHTIDAASLQILWADTMGERFHYVSRFLARHGLAPTRLWYTHTERAELQKMIRVPPPEAIIPVEDNALLHLSGEDYRIIWTPGHSDGHICLFRERDGVLLAADHVLPRITPNIGLYSEHDRPDPLGDYLASLQKVSTLPANVVLPGHGNPLHDLAGRIHEIEAHHYERLQYILHLVSKQASNAAEVANQLFGERLKNDEARRMGVAEVLSHLEYLHQHGQLKQQIDDDGIIRYTTD